MNPMRGILSKLVSVCVFMAMSALIKAISDAVPPGQVVFFRSFFALPPILVWLAWRGELAHGWRTSNFTGHVWRGVVGVTAMGMGFTGLALLPLPEVTAIGFAAPLLTVVFAAMFLGENVRAFRLSMVALGMLGVLVVISPRLSLSDQMSAGETLGVVVVLFGAVMAALAQIFVRKLVATEGTAAIVFWFSVIAATLSLLSLPWGWRMPTPEVAAILVLSGVLGGLGQIFLTTSYRYAEASLVAPFDYASMILAVAVGYFIFDEVPTVWTIAGSVLVVAAGLGIIWRERQLGLERQKQRKATGNSGA